MRSKRYFRDKMHRNVNLSLLFNLYFHCRVTVVQVKANFWVNQDSSVLQYGTTCGATSFTLSAALVAAVALIKFLF